MSLGTRKTKTEGSGNVLRRRRTILAWGFALPFVVVFCVFMLIPLLSSMAMSFTDITSKDLRTPFNVNFVGLDQYIALFHDRRFLHALGVTGIFVLVGLPITMVIALAFAVALNKGSKHLNAFFRAVFYAPVVASVVAVSVVWRYILQKDGLLNSLLAVFGIAGPDWLHDTRYALPALMVMTIWRNMGTLMIIFLAGLQAIPEELKEAAAIDGAGKWRTFRSITLPLLKPTLLLGAVLLSVAYLQFFEESFVMTQGGPLDSTLSAAYYVYQKFGFGQYGIASAASWVLFIIIALVTCSSSAFSRRIEMTATTVAASRPQSNKQSLWRRFVKGRGLSYCVLAVIGVFWIFPFLWMALGSLKTQREILAKPPKLLPEHASLANFAKWFGELNFGTYFTNSMVVAVITVLGNMVLCSMVGYALAKMDFAGKNILFGAVMVTLMVPSVATFVPLFVIISNMGLANSYAALILPFLCQPIGVFLMRQFISGIPDALMEAARVDGAGELRIFFQIVLPQCGPPLATLSILTFLSSWNNFLWPLVAAQTEEKYTLPVALSLYSTGQNATNYSVLLAGAVLVVTPILLLFVFLQRYFIQGVAGTGIK